MIGQASNPMLEKAERGIQQKTAPDMQEPLRKVIQAGMTIMFSPQMAQIRNQRIAQSTNPVQDAAQGAARMLSNLWQQSGKKIPPAVLVPSAIIFAFEFLGLMEKAGKLQITPDVIAQTTQAVTQSVLNLIGVTPEKLQAMVAQARQQKQKGIIAQAQGGQ